MSQSATAALQSATAAVTGRDARELCAWFAPHLGVLHVEQVTCGDTGMVIEARPGSGAACPACGVWSSRVHSGYTRQLVDSPAGGRPVLIRLAVRRFLCRNPACRAVTFAGQVAGLSARYQRRSVPSTPGRRLPVHSRRPRPRGCVMSAAGNGGWWRAPATATPPSTACWPPGAPSGKPRPSWA